jgi:hypothetical protein
VQLNLTLTESQRARARALPHGWPDVVTSHAPVPVGGRVSLVRDEWMLTMREATWRAVHASEVLHLHPRARQRCVVPVAGWRAGEGRPWRPEERDVVHWVAGLWREQEGRLSCTLLTVGGRDLLTLDGWPLQAWLGGWDE